MKNPITFSIQDALKHFNSSTENLTRILNTCLSKGANFSDIFYEHSTSSYLLLQDGKVNQVQNHIDYGAGIRAVKGVQTGFAFSESDDIASLLSCASVASNIANSTQSNTVGNLTNKVFPNRYPVFTDWNNIDLSLKKIFLEKLNIKINSLDSKILKVTVSLSDSTTYVLYANSEGVMTADYRPMVTISARCVMQKDGETETGYTSRSFRADYEQLGDQIIEEISNEVISQTNRLFGAIKPQGGEMAVVMATGDSGILLHEAMGHAFEADFTRRNESIFTDMLGKQVCDESINIVDDGTIEHARGSLNMDDEGVESQKTYVIRNGKLESFLHDRISANFYGITPTGNGRRESFRNIPLPRMRVTYMENGKINPTDIIASVEKGVYVDSFTNGQVQIGAGDFTFFVKTGYLIENGKLTQPIKDVNIIGNGPQALKDISMVGNDMTIDRGAGSCGKEGQYLPVGYGIPTVKIDKLIVGGN